MLRSIGTIAVIGMLTVVSSIPISCASAYCTAKADVVKIAVVSNVVAIIIIKNTFDTLFEVIITQQVTLFYLRKIRRSL
jgi:hypothetical protein